VGNSTTTKADEHQLSLFGTHELADIPDKHDWRVRVSSRARHLKIQVYPHGAVEIVAPKRAKPAHISSFVAEHRDWIKKTRAKFADLRPPERPLPDQIQLRALKETFRIHYLLDDAPRVSERNGLLTVSSPVLSPGACWPLLQKWIKRKGRKHLVPLTHETGAEIGLQPKRIAIRLQKTRWGSCSASGTISLNAAVLLRPAAEMRYVIIHELCHLKHMNHSQRYWQLVESFVPDYRSIERIMDEAWQTSPRWITG
jgi:predicted metal-dependent hydrolase